jgi:DNA-binding response OmpR family regulator
MTKPRGSNPIPAQAPSRIDDAKLQAAARPSSPALRRRILLVDDDPGVRSSIGAVLCGEGYLVLPARDGQEAITLAAVTELDLVLLDLNMPVRDGWDTFEQLSRKHPLVPVIIATAKPNQLFTALGAGVGALMEKPIEIPILLATITRLLTEPREEQLKRLAGKPAEFSFARARTDENRNASQ